VPRAVQNILYVLAGTVTLLAIYLALKYVLPEAYSWLKYLLVVLFPFLIAAIFSAFMEPLVVLLSNQGRFSRAVSVPLAMLLFFGSIGIVLTLLVFRLIKELNDLSMTLPDRFTALQNYIDEWVHKGVVIYGTLPKTVTDNLHATLLSITVTLQNWSRELINISLHVVTGIPGVILVVIISLIATYFFSKDRDKIIELWIRFIPAPWGEKTIEVSRQVSSAFQAYVRAQFVLISISTVISIIGLRLIGAEYAITIGLIIGFFDLIPVLGPGTIYIPWAIWAFINSDVVLGLQLLVLYLLVIVTRAVMEAKVVAVNLGLHPLAVLMAMYIGLKTVGVLGLFLGPILVIAIQAAIKAGISVHK